MKARQKKDTKRIKKAPRPSYLDGDRALAADLYAHRNDPGAASERVTRIEPSPTGMQVVSFRLPTEELRLILQASKATGESLSGFVRSALAIRLGRELTISPIHLDLVAV